MVRGLRWASPMTYALSPQLYALNLKPEAVRFKMQLSGSHSMSLIGIHALVSPKPYGLNYMSPKPYALNPKPEPLALGSEC